jgi:ketosteroid isomerase-like protein
MLKEGDLRRRAFLRIAAMGVAATQFGVFGTARAQSDEQKPDEESEITYDNEAIVREAYRTAEGSVMDVPGFVGLFADDGVINLGHAGVEPLGLESYRGDKLGDLVVSVGTYFPDIHRELHRVNVLGDMVAVELSIQGTFLGPLQTASGTFEPTGAKVNGPCADFWYLRNGKIERFDCYIMFDTMRAQMGLS